MHPRELIHLRAKTAYTGNLATADYRIEVIVSVENVRQLWSFAFNKALLQPALTLEDVYDLIGPREDPVIEACLALLAEPGELPGCSLDDFSITSARHSH